MQQVIEFVVNTYNEISWFFSLGFVTVVSVILSILFINLLKVTVFKKYLITASANSKDKVIGTVGSIVTLVIYGIVYVGTEMITQKTVYIVLNPQTAWITISSGAAVAWVAAKGLYTVLHKWIKRVKEGKIKKGDEKELREDIAKVKDAVRLESSEPKVIDTQIGKKKIF